MFHCPVGVWVIDQRAIILSATVRSPTVIEDQAKNLNSTARHYDQQAFSPPDIGCWYVHTE